MKTIITISDIQRYKHIATAFNGEKNIDGYILEAQLCDLKPWLGDAFLLQLVQQRSTNTLSDENDLILRGGEYTYEGNQYYLEGIAAFMAYSVHARYILRSSVSATQFGVVVKESDYSTPASSKQIQEIKSTSEATAEAVKQDIILLLQRLSKNYPLYKSCNSINAGRKQLFRIIGE